MTKDYRILQMSLKPSVAFITFAGSPGETDPKYSDILGARNRLIRQAVESNQFSKCIGLDWPQVTTLSNQYKLTLPAKIHRYHFTPIILKLIALGAFGKYDYFFYAGSGCEINTNKFATKDLRQMLRKSKDNLFYVEHTLLPEYMFTKEEVIRDLAKSSSNLNTPQIMATFFVVATTARVGELNAISDEWLNFSTIKEGYYIQDDFNTKYQHANFVAHRNDQSIFSIILKNHGICSYMERQRNFSRFFPGIRGSTTFLWTPRNRNELSALPKGVNSKISGALVSLISPFPNSLHYVRSQIRFHKQPKKKVSGSEN